ncbi:hypothetical protein SDC9_110879 [bioreactor metagenome]|uniref:Uncharacterized protein n=1 Tax=bioreactor metagenome TaxID=1076179 RepID=A0A645BQ93_9ZZZZ
MVGFGSIVKTGDCAGGGADRGQAGPHGEAAGGDGVFIIGAVSGAELV